MNRPGPFVLALAGLAFAFLYLPLLVLILYSFNDSRLVTVWGGLSLRWYGALLADRAFLEAAGTSLLIALASATGAAFLGTLAGLALARVGRFRLRGLLGGLALLPLVLPEVVMGLSLLLLFVSMAQTLGFPAERGMGTIIAAHVTFGMAYVTVVVQARLAALDPTLEDAAADLGARPATIFRTVILPRLWPGILAGWLLAFTLSLDDLVIASFVSGPGATTLPMAIWSSVRLGVSPQVNALATLLVVFVTALLLLAGWVAARRRQPRSTGTDP